MSPKPTAAVLAVLGALLAVPVQAAVSRTYVASTGDNANTAYSCDFAHPCRTFQVAFSQTTTGGEILAVEASIEHEQACGATPINGLLLCAKQRSMRIELLDLRNSGDTAGERSRVVGYASFALREGKPHAEH